MKRKKGESPNEDDTGSSSGLRVPHDTINEGVVIAAAIVSEEARSQFLRTIPVDGFYGQGHAEIWAALQELDRKGLSYDPATLRSIDPKVDTTYLASLLKSRPKAPPNLRHHVARLNWDRTRIEFAAGPVVELLDALKDRKCSPEELRGIAKRLDTALKGHGSENYLRNGASIVAEHSGVLSRRRHEQATYGFGIPALDTYNHRDDPSQKAGRARLLPGAAPSQISVVTGLSGSGKSTTMANALSGFASSGRRCLVGAWEQTAGTSLEMTAAIRLGYSRRDLTEGNYGDEEQQELEEEMERLTQHLRYIDIPMQRKEKRFGANDRSMDIIEQAIIDSKCEIFVADLFRRTLRETTPDDEEAALYRMQEMASKLHVHIILVQQQRLKDVEQRPDKRPTREAIKGSGAWTEVADTIIGWHRPAQWKNVADDHIEAIVLKQRYGEWPLGVEIEWDPEFGTLGATGRSFNVNDTLDDEMADGGIEDFLSKGKAR